MQNIAKFADQGSDVTRWVFAGPAGLNFTADTRLLKDRGVIPDPLAGDIWVHEFTGRLRAGAVFRCGPYRCSR